MTPDIFEKSGIFYLGRRLHGHDFSPSDDAYLYESRDLTTHAVCVGMTGSGKTGLGIAVLEEAAMDRIPAIVIDPKGDLGNLLLSFTELTAERFLPWISEEEAARKETTREALAQKTAETWMRGLGMWGQSEDRILRMRESVDFALFTPGATAGRPLALLRSLRAPSVELRADLDLYRERISDTVTGLLDLAGIQADPLQSREHILLAHLLQAAWDAGEDLDLAAFVGRVPQPPIQRIGAFDIDSFFPAKDRFALAMRLNALLASPSFAAWTEGEALDIDTLLQAPDGRPRISILNIAHLSDKERMFLVTTVIGELISWMRRQPGTSSLRALFYMDEIFGYLPPVAEPPSKRGLLTLLKQARAFGLGLMLCTQNPADIDYKALSNAGTWFIGRLQTERDRDRLMEGLSSSMDAGANALDRAEVARMISGLGARRFLVQNVHRGYPELFETRWVMSYMAGPLSRTQVRSLVERPASPPPTVASYGEYQPPHAPSPTGPFAVPVGQVASHVPSPTGPFAVPVGQAAHGSPAPSQQVPPYAAHSTAPAFEAAPGAAQPTAPANAWPAPPGFVAAKPLMGTGVSEGYVRIGEPRMEDERLLWRPMALGCATAVIDRKRPPLYAVLPLSRISFIEEGPVPVSWEAANACPFDERSVVLQPDAAGLWECPPSIASDARAWKQWERDLIAWWGLHAGVMIHSAPALKLLSEPNESEERFRHRVNLAAREARDAAMDALNASYSDKLLRIDSQISGYDSKVASAHQQSRARTFDAAARIGMAFFGGGSGSRKAASASRQLATAARQSDRLATQANRAMDQRATAVARRQLLQEEYHQKVAGIEQQFSVASSTVESTLITAAKSAIQLRYFSLVWVPYYERPDGRRRRAWMPSS